MTTKCYLSPILLGTLLLALPEVGNAQFIWTTNNGTITITGYTGSGGEVVIPSTITGLPVTSIGTNAFQFCLSLTRVTIPDSVTSIGNSAFFDCSSLGSVTLGTNVTSLEAYAFGNCTSLAGVTLPNSVTNLGVYAFGDCAITNFTIPDGVTSIGTGAFYDCHSLANLTIGTNVTSIGSSAFYYCTNLAYVAIPNHVTNIGAGAFGSCNSMTNLTVGANVTSIGDYAFYGCSRLAGIYFQGNAPSLESSASVFYGDYFAMVYYLPGTSGWSSSFGDRPAVMLNPPNPAGSLQVTLSPTEAIAAGAQWQVDGGVAQPSGATVLGLSVGNHIVTFSPANGWALPASQSVAVSADSTATASGTYGELKYQTNNGAITLTRYTGPGNDVVLPSTINGLPVTCIGPAAFEFCTSLTSALVPDSVTNFVEDAFWGCTSLTNITIGNSVTDLGIQAFGDCTSLASVTIPNSVTYIGFQTFTGCSSLANLTIGSRVSGISSDALDNCKSLASITVNTNNLVYSSVAGVLFNKSQTKLIKYPTGRAGAYTIPQSVTSIESNAFFRCSSLVSVNLGTNLTSIGSQAFFQCQKLSTITIPASVTNIGISAFYNCVLTAIHFLGNAPGLGAHAFDADNMTTVYYLPGTTGWGTPGTLFGGICQTALWLPQAQTSDASFGVQNSQFGFNITWASDLVVVVEACTNLVNPVWTPVGTNTLTGGTSYFSDSQWTNYPGRFYRLRQQ